jgi:hypothetical protein
VNHSPSGRSHQLSAAAATAVGLAAATDLTLFGAPPAAAAAPAPAGAPAGRRPGEGVKSILATGAGLLRLDLEIPFYGHPTFSPDGSRFTYTDGWSVCTVRADGSDRRWVLDGGSVPAFPTLVAGRSGDRLRGGRDQSRAHR